MTEEDIKLRCLELAIERARQEFPDDYRAYVADLQTWFYNRVVTQQKGGQAKVSKDAKALLE
jgi:hypothetical protein